jgi:hypothetical protein
MEQENIEKLPISLLQSLDIFKKRDEVLVQRIINEKAKLREKPCKKHKLTLYRDCSEVVHCSQCWTEWGGLKVIFINNKQKFNKKNGRKNNTIQ